MNKKHIFSDSRGMSLVELIVVVLIMAIITSGGAVTMNIVYNASVSRAAAEFTVAMQETRILAKSAEESDVVTLKLLVEDGSSYAIAYVNGSERQKYSLANDRVSVSVGPAYSRENGLIRKQITGSNSTNSVTYTFKKSTGGIAETGQEDVFFTHNDDVEQVIVVGITGRAYVKK